MKGFKRAVGLGLLVGGALGGWGCSNDAPKETRGFQDPVQMQHRSTHDQAGDTAQNNLGHPSNEGGGGRSFNSDSKAAMGGGSTAPNAMEGDSSRSSGQQPGGSAELGTGLAESYRGAPSSEGTGGSGRDAGTMMDAGTTMDAGTGAMDAGTGKMDAGTGKMDAGMRR